jgi:hypothetical protein
MFILPFTTNHKVLANRFYDVLKFMKLMALPSKGLLASTTSLEHLWALLADFATIILCTCIDVLSGETPPYLYFFA